MFSFLVPLCGHEAIVTSHWDSVVSSFAADHPPHSRKRGLYGEVFDLSRQNSTCRAAYNIVTRRSSGFCGVLGNDSTCEQSHCCLSTEETLSSILPSSREVGARDPRTVGRRFLKRRPTSVLPPCFSPR